MLVLEEVAMLWKQIDLVAVSCFLFFANEGAFGDVLSTSAIGRFAGVVRFAALFSLSGDVLCTSAIGRFAGVVRFAAVACLSDDLGTSFRHSLSGSCTGGAASAILCTSASDATFLRVTPRGDDACDGPSPAPPWL